MIRYIYIISVLLLTGLVSKAQIGVNTENLMAGAIFQVDPLKNSTSAGGGIADDVIVTADNSIVGLGLGGKVSGDAQLELNSQKKALKLNEVKLKSLTDIVTVPNPRAGMTVYNTVAVASEEVEVGWYYFDGVKWNRILQAVREPALQNEYTIIFAAPENTVIPAMSYADASSGVYADARKMLFRTKTVSKIIIPSDGAYVFALRLYFYTRGATGTGSINYNTQSVMYVFMVSKTQNKVIEKAVVTFPFTQQASGYYSYRLVMGTLLSANEEVEFYVARGLSPEYDDCPISLRVLSTSNPEIKSAARTSLSFWKL